MKKFCSSCGNQLELSQRFCGQCGTVNPFFVAAFTLLSDQSESLEKLRLEKERIDKELQEIEEAQKEFERQELLKKQAEEEERLRIERIAHEKIQREIAERERIEANLKREIERVKEETQKELERQQQLIKQAAELERQKAVRAEQERIEREIAEREKIEAGLKQEIFRVKQEAQKEFERQELLRHEAEELERKKAEAFEQERLARENAEREKIESSFKNELLKVKEEAEQYKKETIDLVREVRKEVKDDILLIEEENKRLKQEVESLKHVPEKPAPVIVEERQPEPLTPGPALPHTEARERNYKSIFVVLSLVIIIGALLTYFYFPGSKSGNEQLAETETTHDQTQRTGKVVDTILANETAIANAADTATTETITATPAILKTNTSPAAPSTIATKPAEPKPANKTFINPAKVKMDLTGMKVSGCGIVLNSGDIQGISNLVQVEKSETYIKYKCTLKISQGADHYTATPYLYYNQYGDLIKIDGTNCE